jgi:hypothetical protein
MKFHAASGPTKDNAPAVPGSYKTDRDGGYLPDGTHAGTLHNWWVDMASLEDIQALAAQAGHDIHVLIYRDSSKTPHLYVDTPHFVMDDGIPTAIRENTRDELLGMNEKTRTQKEEIQKAKNRGDSTLARAKAELEATAETRAAEQKAKTDKIMTKLMAEDFIKSARNVASRTLMRDYVHGRDPKFVDALEDRMAALTSLDALNDMTLDAEVLKTVSWIDTLGLDRDRMYALLLRGLLASILQNRILDGDESV